MADERNAPRRDSLTPAERVLRARMGAYALHATHDSRETSAAGRRAANSRFLLKVDPDGVLPEPERLRRAEAARKSWMTRIAYLSARARSAKRDSPQTPRAGTRTPVGSVIPD